MEKSNSIKNLAGALLLFHVKVGKIKKDANNPFYNSKYASLSNILEAISEPLTESGLTFLQLPSEEHGLTTILIHAESGEYMQATYFMKPTKADPQGIGSAITYQRRYALCAILGLNIEEDDDANKASEPTENKQQPKKTDEDERPWLTEKQFNAALERINKGEIEIIEKTKQAFKIKKVYRETLEKAALQTA